jgi:hypothetical protein
MPRIDWRRQFQALEPYFAGRGGVVRVRVNDSSPASNFSKAIRHTMLRDHYAHPCTCAQLDSQNSNTHYLQGVVLQLERSLELDQETVSAAAGGLVQIGTGNEAQSVEISNINVVYRDDDYARSSRESARLDRVADAIKERLETERVALLFLNSHTYDSNTLSRVRKQLWDARLQTLTDSGLLLIDISDPSRGCGPDWPPDPDLLLDLPERFDEASRPYAHMDLVNFALANEIAANADQADMFARTLLETSETIRDMYAGLARMLAGQA